MRLFLFAIFCGAAGVAAAQDLVVYDDEARNGFDGAYSYGGGTDLAETGTVFAGTASIAYTGSEEFNAVSLARAFVPDIPASQYHTLRFYVHGGTTGGQRLRLYFARDSESESVTIASAVIDPYIVGSRRIVANEWRLVSVPLEDFGVQVPFDRIDFQTELGVQPVLYLDEIRLVGTPTMETATAIVPRGATSVDVPVRFFAGSQAVVGMNFSLAFVRGAAIAASGTVIGRAGQIAPDGNPLCAGPATTDPTGTEVRGIASSNSNSTLQSGTLCTFTFPLDPAAPEGSYPFVVGGLAPEFGNAIGATVPGEFYPGGLIVAEGTAPTVSYSPPPPSQIDLPGGALGTPVEALINLQSLGGSGVGRVRLACSVGAPFVLSPATFLVGAGDDPLALAVGCTLAVGDAIGELECTETDEPGATQRVRSWPLLCPAGSAAGFVADDATGNRNGPVGVGIRFIGDGIVRSMAGDLLFDPAQLTPTQVSAANGGICFLKPPNNDRIAFNVPAGPQPLPDAETTYCNVVFVIADDAPPLAVSPLTFAATSCLDANNAGVVCVTNDGAVTTSAFDSSPRPGGALSLVAAPGQSSVSGSILAINFGNTAIAASSCTPEPADGFTVTPGGAFSIAANNFRLITVGCTPPASGLPPRVSDLSCLLQDTDPARIVRYRVLCSNGASQGPLPGASLTGTGASAGDEVGTSLATTVAPNGDEIMVVGAPFGGPDDGGRAFVLVRPAGSPPSGAQAKRASAIGAWDDAFATSTAHVLSATNAIGDKFGNAVAIDTAGDTIAIGAPAAGAGGAGRVLVFERPAGGWGPLETPDLVIEAPTGAAAGDTIADDFGAELSFTANGMLVVGAPLADVGAGATDAGAAYAYASGSIVPATIVRSPQVETGAGFGGAIASDGDALAIGAPLENAGGNADQGAVYVMTAPGAPAEPTRRVTAATGAIGDKFGQSVAITNRMLVVGAPSDNTATGTDSGSATVYSGDAGSGYVERMTLVPGGDATQQAGASVATNGDVILLGAPFAPVAGRPAQGRVFAYDVPESFTAPPPVATIIDSPAGQVGDRFGARLATSARRLLIGVPKDDNELGLGGTTVQVDEGRADPFLFDRISRSGFE